MISKAWVGRTYVSPFYSVGLPRKAVASYWHMLLHSNIFNLHSTYDKFALTILKLFFRVFWWFSCTVFLGGSNIQLCLRKKVYLISPYASVQLLVASCQILDLLFCRKPHFCSMKRWSKFSLRTFPIHQETWRRFEDFHENLVD